MTSKRIDDARAEFLRDSTSNRSHWESFKAGWDARCADGTEAGKELRELHTIRVVHSVIAAMGGGAVLGSWIGRSLLGGILGAILLGVVPVLGAARQGRVRRMTA
jgi:hypothetical protein